MSTIPFDVIVEKFLDGDNYNLSTLSMVKLTRVLRIQKLINYLNSTEEIKNTLNLMKTLLFVILYIHVTACFWFFIITKAKLWTPGNWACPSCDTRDYFTDEETKENFLNKFMISIYAAIMSLNGNDILPTTGIEMFTAILGLLTGCIMQAYIMGNLVVMVQSMNRRM